MFFRNSPAKPYVLFAISVLVFAAGIVVGHGLKIVGLGLAAWSVWTVLSSHRHGGRRVEPSGDRHGS